jgi:hypothetical protein
LIFLIGFIEDTVTVEIICLEDTDDVCFDCADNAVWGFLSDLNIPQESLIRQTLEIMPLGTRWVLVILDKGHHSSDLCNAKMM